MKKVGIYSIVCIENNKMYIGRSHNLDEVMEMHLDFLDNGHHYSEKMQQDYNQYGWKAFEFKILEIIYQDQDLGQLEEKYIYEALLEDKDLSYVSLQDYAERENDSKRGKWSRNETPLGKLIRTRQYNDMWTKRRRTKAEIKEDKEISEAIERYAKIMKEKRRINKLLQKGE